jgi:phosphopantothenoylcysteine synthetase/decarboxylase
MRILVTAGNTQTPIDDVRVITNVFSGRTGSSIALAAHARNHSVCLLTSHPELVADHSADSHRNASEWEVYPYRTFDDLRQLMERSITTGKFDVIIHCAAVSDYELAGTFAPVVGTHFDPDRAVWEVHQRDEQAASSPAMVEVTTGKIKSSFPELWLRLVPTPKLIDSIRKPWGFDGILVKFKLEVGPTDEELIRIADASRRHSHADLIVANTRAGMHEFAYLGPVNGAYQRLERAELATRLLDQIEVLKETPLSQRVLGSA